MAMIGTTGATIEVPMPELRTQYSAKSIEPGWRLVQLSDVEQYSPQIFEWLRTNVYVNKWTHRADVVSLANGWRISGRHDLAEAGFSEALIRPGAMPVLVKSSTLSAHEKREFIECVQKETKYPIYLVIAAPELHNFRKFSRKQLAAGVKRTEWLCAPRAAEAVLPKDVWQRVVYFSVAADEYDFPSNAIISTLPRTSKSFKAMMSTPQFWHGLVKACWGSHRPPAQSGTHYVRGVETENGPDWARFGIAPSTCATVYGETLLSESSNWEKTYKRILRNLNQALYADRARFIADEVNDVDISLLRHTFADKSEAAQQRESEAHAAFREVRDEMEAAAMDTEPPQAQTRRILSPDQHLTSDCWRDFNRFVKSFDGWSASRKEATIDDAVKFEIFRMGKSYWIDVTYRPKGCKRKSKPTVPEPSLSLEETKERNQKRREFVSRFVRRNMKTVYDLAKRLEALQRIYGDFETGDPTSARFNEIENGLQ